MLNDSYEYILLDRIVDKVKVSKKKLPPGDWARLLPPVSFRIWSNAFSTSASVKSFVTRFRSISTSLKQTLKINYYKLDHTLPFFLNTSNLLRIRNLFQIVVFVVNREISNLLRFVFFWPKKVCVYFERVKEPRVF